ncbi:DsrE family protein [Algoriphagus terrigena]|uniref:DsrE family protein n=1 Tax=Algoriphagus terrigena TaxID=344884 RepID=UPI000479098C|nr:DsrE family protein [Algoriphagus terrigena]
MKTWLLSACCFLILSVGFAQQAPVKIVFDVTSGDSTVHQAVVRHVSMMAEAYPGSQFEVVIYGGAIDLVSKDRSVVSNEVQKLAANPNIKFAVCEITMKKYQVESTQLIPGVIHVPDGILEIYKRQQEGWGYIKESK